MDQAVSTSRTVWNPDKFRLRRLVERLVEMDEIEVRNEPVALSELSPIIEATKKGVLFKKAGPEQHEVAGAVSASRTRLAAAFGVPEEKMREEFLRRQANPQKTFIVPTSDAPVQEIVLTGDQIDLYKLPFHVQHEYDGGPYITSGNDFIIDPVSKRSNVGCRRLMLRGKDKCGFNATAPSDLQNIYRACVARGERLPMSFTIGAHPIDTMAASHRGVPGQDEINTIATFRGEPLAVVKCLTNDIYVPADAEIVLEGYVDERGYIDNEGPYGEYMGYYGPMHGDPCFHVTAITRRRDVLYQTIKHGVGKNLGWCDGAPMGAVGTEARAWQVLKQAGIDVVDVFSPPGPGVNCHLRVSIKKRSNADPHAAIVALLGMLRTTKHVYITDDDVDVRSSEQMEWAMSGRFQASKDIYVMKDMPFMPMDMSGHNGISDKVGFDCTWNYPRPTAVTARVPEAAKIGGPARFQTVQQALETGPMHFAKLMSVLGSRDGRELVREIEALRDAGHLDRNSDGEYYLKK